MRVLAIGGTGFIGRRVVEALEQRGHEAWTLGRGEGGDRHLRGDRSRAGGLADSVSERRFDAVVDLAAYHPREVAEAVETFDDVSRYVFVSSGVVHRDLHGRPAREEDVVLPEGDPPETELDYTSGKRWCERVLTDARELGFRGVAVRPPAVLGAADRTSRIAGYFARIEDGRPLLAPAGLLDRPLGIVWNRDIGVACALLAEGAGASSAYNVAVPDVPLRRLVGDAADVLGVARPELVEVDEQTLAAAGFDVYDVSPYGPAHKRPGGYDLTRVRTELGFEPSPLGAALVECAAWYRSVRPTGSGYARREEELALVTK